MSSAWHPFTSIQCPALVRVTCLSGLRAYSLHWNAGSETKSKEAVAGRIRVGVLVKLWYLPCYLMLDASSR